MKKVFAIVLALMLTFSLAACSGNGDTGGDTPSGDFKVDVMIFDYSDPYITSVRTLMAEKFDGIDGLTAQFHDSANDQSKQNDLIETALSQGTNLLIVNIVTTASEEAATNIVNLAKNAGIPVIFFNREISDATINSYPDQAVFVGTDPDEAGYMQGEMIAELLNADFESYDLNGDGSISYIMFKGELGNAEADGRTEYSVYQANLDLEAAGNGTLVYYDASNTDLYQAANWKASESQAAMETALGTNPFSGNNPIELVIANNDDMALGAVTALNTVGYNTGEGDFIPVVGVDATTDAQAAIADGKMAGTVKQDADGMASAIVFLATNIKDGKALLDGTSSYNIDEDVAKIRIPYAKFTG